MKIKKFIVRKKKKKKMASMNEYMEQILNHC